MALALIIIGAALIIVAIRNTYADLGTLLAKDFTGEGNFLYWIAALAVIGAVGYVPTLRGPSRALLALIVLVFFLTNGTGFFDKVASAIKGAKPATTAAVEPPAITGQIPVKLTIVGGGGKSSGGGAADVVGGIAKVLPLIGGLL